MNFEQFLEEKWSDLHPEVYTNNGEGQDSFDAWLADLQVDEVIAYAEEWGKTLTKNV